MNRKILIIALAACGNGISGGDRIFIEFSKRWSKVCPVEIVVWEEGLRMCQRMGLKEGLMIKFHNVDLNFWAKRGFLVNYIARIIYSIYYALVKSLDKNERIIIYSASEFWMDSLPGFILKNRFKKSTWVASWYQTAPKPWIGFTKGIREQSYRLNSLHSWLAQLLIKPLIEKIADFVCVNNEEEQNQFPRFANQGRTIIVTGAVNLMDRDRYIKAYKRLPKIYDGIFQGRFHPQKGVVELIDIWRKIVDKRPQAKLAMIGDGPLMDSVKMRVRENKLENNVKLFGYIFDGPKKYKLICQSKVVMHPAFYDSGGMASAEAMMFGLPCVGFNLSSYKYYYPKGMVKVKIGDLDAFANKVLALLENREYRKKIAEDAIKMIKRNWSWEDRAEQVLKAVNQ